MEVLELERVGGGRPGRHQTNSGNMGRGEVYSRLGRAVSKAVAAWEPERDTSQEGRAEQSRAQLSREKSQNRMTAD